MKEAAQAADYGSQNHDEEAAFIRRVVAPPKRKDRRRRQKRAAAIGASVVMLAAGAVATYMVMPSENASSVTTETLASDVTKFVVPVDDANDDQDPDSDLPTFSDYDTNNDGTVSVSEYVKQLASYRDDALDRVANGRITAEQKEDYSARLNRNFDKEVTCVTRLAARVRYLTS
jgi:hypothetical protein